MNLSRYKREIAAAAAYIALLLIVLVLAPSFFSGGNLRDLAINNISTLLVALGMTLVILAGEIDISIFRNRDSIVARTKPVVWRIQAAQSRREPATECVPR